MKMHVNLLGALFMATTACGLAPANSQAMEATAPPLVASTPLPETSPAKHMLGDYFGVNMMARRCLVMVQQPVWVNPEWELEIWLSPSGENVKALAKTSFFNRPSGTLIYVIAPKNERDLLKEVSLEWDENGLTSFSVVRWNHSSGAKTSVVSAHSCKPLVKE